jgi:drug/metabolite transporter (DMT)-like permease
MGLIFLFGAGSSPDVFGVLFGVLSSFLFALYTTLLERFFGDQIGAHQRHVFTAGAILSVIVLFFSEGALLPKISTEWMNFAALILVSTLLAHISYAKAIQWSGKFLAGILSYFAILFGFLIDELVFGVGNSREWIGGLLVVVALMILFRTQKEVECHLGMG